MSAVKSLQKLLSKEDCEKILKRNSHSPVQLVSYKITTFQEGVAGFLGDHLKLTIKFISKKNLQKITYFMKTLPQFNINQLDYVVESGIFRKEVILYRNLLDELLKITKFGPKCYYVKDNLIVLEDLKSKGFKMQPKSNYFTNEQIEGMLKTIARFHGATLIFEQKYDLKLNEKFKEEVKEACICFTEGQPRYKWLISVTKCLTDLLAIISKKRNWNYEEILTKITKFVFEDLEQLISPSKRFKNVLTHDDLWCNNLLFNDNNECAIVDFQLVRYTPPCMDFLTSLYLNLDCLYVENNLHRFVDSYYSYLVEVLKENNLDGNNILPKSEFEESIEHYKVTALTETVMYGTHTFISEELADEIMSDINKYNEFSFLNRSKYVLKEFENNELYRERLCGPLTLLAQTLQESK